MSFVESLLRRRTLASFHRRVASLSCCHQRIDIRFKGGHCAGLEFLQRYIILFSHFLLKIRGPYVVINHHVQLQNLAVLNTFAGALACTLVPFTDINKTQTSGATIEVLLMLKGLTG